jgi:hypothetical protein
VLLAAAAATTQAQTTAGFGTVLVIPVVAQTGSFNTEVFVRNAGSGDITVNVKYYAAIDIVAAPGLRPCTALAVPANRTASFSLATQCTLGTASTFGMLVLEDAAAEKINAFSAFSRTQAVSAATFGNGFSVEAFPAGNFSSANSGVIGTKRLAPVVGGFPGFTTNCFVGALGEAVDYQIRLFDEDTGTQIGSDLIGTLQPYQNRRYSDIIALVGGPATIDNVRVRFMNPTNGAALVGLCTVQENRYLGADFRIAKAIDADDNRQRRTICYSQTTCGTLDNLTNINDVALRSVHQTLIAQPDYVKCELVGPRVNDLEMRLRGPGDAFSSTVVAGGNNLTSFYAFTGHRGEVNNGFVTRWFIDVSFREGGNTTTPIPYGITCHSGNGVTVPWFLRTTADNF